MANIMIDIETLDTEPTAKIVQIGAAKFNLGNGDLSESFCVNVNPDCIDNMMRTKSVDTMNFWNEPAQKQARESWQTNQIPLRQALIKLSEFIKLDDLIWANPPTFDLVILRHAFKLTNVKCPWHYRAERDSRTIWNFAPIPARVFAATEAKKRFGAAIEHNALHDAITQAYGICFVSIWMKMNKW